MKSDFLSGFVSIIGSPNVGKSTIMNAMIGQKVTIVSSKSQTTRNKIQGVLTRDDYQIVFIDTPGIHSPRNKLGEFMVKVAYEAIHEVECVLFVVDATREKHERDDSILERLSKSKSKVIAVINKVDIAEKENIDVFINMFAKHSFIQEVICTSAITKQGLVDVEKHIKKYLVAGPQYFPEDMITDQPERLLCSEFIREAALRLLKEEVPYGIGVDIDKMKTRAAASAKEDAKQITDIWATIYCERDGQKGIIIGKNGEMLKKIGIGARKEIEWILGTKVNLQLWVKVTDDWRNKATHLRMLGYDTRN